MYEDLTGFTEVLSVSIPDVGYTTVWYHPVSGVLQVEANGGCSRIYIEHLEKLTRKIKELSETFAKAECPDCGFKFNSESDWVVCPRCGSEFKIEIGGKTK